jgi:hypothetical protein
MMYQLRDILTFIAPQAASARTIEGAQRNGFLTPNLKASLGIRRKAGMIAQMVVDAISPATLGVAPFNIINVGVHPDQVHMKN